VNELINCPNVSLSIERIYSILNANLFYDHNNATYMVWLICYGFKNSNACFQWFFFKQLLPMDDIIYIVYDNEKAVEHVNY